MIQLPFSFDDDKLNQKVSEHINRTLRAIVLCQIELLQGAKTAFLDDPSFMLDSIFPPVMIREDPANCRKRLSSVVRTSIKPVYRLILFRCIENYLDFIPEDDRVLLHPLDKEIHDQILNKYGSFAVESVTNIESYLDNLFDDWDFLPEFLNHYVVLSMENPVIFQMAMSYEELDEYLEIMDADLREEYIRYRKQMKQPLCTPVQSLQQHVLKALLSTQNNRLYWGKTENEINDGIRDNLGMVYDVKDQTRRGESTTGSASGELDFLVYQNGTPIAIMEALKLDNLKKSYLTSHIEKVLYSYDPVGYQNVFLLVYVTAKEFKHFWDKFLAFISQYDYRFPALEPLREMNLPYAEVKHAIIVLNRNGMPVTINYYAIHLRT